MSQEIYPNDFFIRGNLNVIEDVQTTGQIISGGQELLGLISSQISALSLASLSGTFDNLNSVYSTVQSNSSTVWNYQGTDLKGLSANWQNTFTAVTANSAKWESVYSNVNSNSATYATSSFVQGNFFPLSGGYVTGNTHFNGNVTIFGDLSSSGTQTFANTVFTTTSSLSVYHVGGTGPALIVSQDGAGDIASFYDLDQGVEVLHVGGVNSTYPNVGIKVSNPNKDFTVNGEISASGNIWTSGTILSAGQDILSLVMPNINTVYNTVNANSAVNWNYQGTDLKSLSADWQTGYQYAAAYSSVSSTFLTSETDSQTLSFNEATKGLSISNGNTVSLSSLIDNTAIDTGVRSLTSQWNSAYSTVNSNSATIWNYQGTDLKALSGNWQNAYTNLIANSGAYLSAVDLAFWSVSANWDSVYNTVQANSAIAWNYQGTDLKDLSAGWVGGNEAYTNLVANSAAYLSSVDLSFLAASANWDSVYNTVQTNSAAVWSYQGDDIKALSGNWQEAYTNVINNSAAYLSAVDLSFLSVSGNWDSVYNSVANTSATWDSVYSSFSAASSTFLTSETDSQTLSFDESTKDLSISNGNTVSLSALVDGTAIDNGVRALTSVWDSTYSTVQTNSATTWNYQGTDLKDLSANWQNAYTTVTNSSASWDSVYSNVVANSATNVKTAATTVPGTSAITTIVAVSALPVSPDPNTLYIVL